MQRQARGMRGIYRRQGRAVLDRRQASRVAVGHNLDRALAAPTLVQQPQSVLADSLIRGDVFCRDRARFAPGQFAPCRRRRLLQDAMHARQRPVQIDGGGPRRGQGFDHQGEARIAGIIGKAQRHAIGGRGADQRRTAYLHDANRQGGIFQGGQSPHHRLARQTRLVEDEDGRLTSARVLDERRMPVPRQLSLPWQYVYFLPLPQGQGSLRPTLGVCRSTGCAGLGAAAAPSASS